jgi:hypothetical protein
MANVLGPASEPAYILIGVDEARTILGVKTVHQDDLHQKVRGILNACPDFSYGEVVVRGLSVGVYEIRRGRARSGLSRRIEPRKRCQRWFRIGPARTTWCRIS